MRVSHNRANTGWVWALWLCVAAFATETPKAELPEIIGSRFARDSKFLHLGARDQ